MKVQVQRRWSWRRWSNQAGLCIVLLVAAVGNGYQPVTGQPHPDFTLPDIRTGEPISLSDFLGQRILLVHFAAWSDKCRDEVPRWRQDVDAFVSRGELQVIGVAQEQHAERSQLFAQLHQLDWPIVHDPLNTLELKAIPMLLLIDEHGIVRGPARNMDSVGKFMQTKYESLEGAEESATAIDEPSTPVTEPPTDADSTAPVDVEASPTPNSNSDPPTTEPEQVSPATTPVQPPTGAPIQSKPDAASQPLPDDPPTVPEVKATVAVKPERKRRPAPIPEEAWTLANSELSAFNWIDAGDAFLLWAEDPEIDRAIAAYQNALALEPDDAHLHFRLGVAYRMRYDSPGLTDHDDDFQQAVTFWTKALRLDRTQYIWRRRLQQYGPRLKKPVAFCDWIAPAEQAIRDRGEQPVALRVPIADSELAVASSMANESTESQPFENPDPNGSVMRDTGQMVRIFPVIVAHSDPKKSVVRIHLQLIPQPTVKWSDQAGPVIMWVDAVEGWSITPQRAESQHARFEGLSVQRTVEFEAQPTAPPTDADSESTVEPTDDVDSPSETNATPGDSNSEVAAEGREADEELPIEIAGFVLYHVCPESSSDAVRLRHDFRVHLQPAPPAPKAGPGQPAAVDAEQPVTADSE